MKYLLILFIRRLFRIKPYYHSISNNEIKWAIKNKKTVEFVMNNYKQPKWCLYPDALKGIMGCWSLTNLENEGTNNRKSISLSFCSDCDECDKKYLTKRK